MMYNMACVHIQALVSRTLSLVHGMCSHLLIVIETRKYMKYYDNSLGGRISPVSPMVLGCPDTALLVILGILWSLDNVCQWCDY
jgi:hypothetical protein